MKHNPRGFFQTLGEDIMTGVKSNFRNVFCGTLVFISLSANTKPEPLKPLPLILNNYNSAIFNSLLSKTTPRLWMIAFPSRTSAYAIILDEKIDYEEGEPGDYEVKSRQHYLKFTLLKNKPRRSHPFDHNQTYNIDLTKEIERYEIPIKGDFAKIIEDAWLRTLKETRYTDKCIMTLDGPTYIFHYDQECRQDFYGMTVQTTELVELGLKLGSLAKSEEKERNSLLKECMKLALNIAKETAPQSLQPTVKTPIESGKAQGTAAGL